MSVHAGYGNLTRGWDFPILHGLSHDGFFSSTLSGLFLGPAVGEFVVM